MESTFFYTSAMENHQSVLFIVNSRFMEYIYYTIKCSNFVLAFKIFIFKFLI